MPDHRLKPGPEIAILALRQSTRAALHSLHAVFASVGGTWEEPTGEPPDGRRLSPRIVPKDGAPITRALGFTMTSNGRLGASDVVVVRHVAIPQDGDLGAPWEEELAWLRGRHAAGAIICSVCTGAVVLAEAGLIDGLEATTRWSTVDFPRARPVRSSHAPTGPGERIVTRGGATAWEDMALWPVARLSSSPDAVRVTRIFLLCCTNRVMAVRPLSPDRPVPRLP